MELIVCQLCYIVDILLLWLPSKKEIISFNLRAFINHGRDRNPFCSSVEQYDVLFVIKLNKLNYIS